MALKSFSFPFPSLAISNSCFKEDPFASPFCLFTYQVPWLIVLVSSFSLYAFCSGFHLLSFLLTCSALALATIAFPLLRASSSASDRNADSQLKTSLLEEEEEAIEAQSHTETECTWPFGADPDSTQECSDGSGSISDEESLIEITLPNGYCMDPEKHDQPPLTKSCAFHCCSDGYSMELMELLAQISDINEEENMIEIDIAMGSIKCPRLEIKA